MVEVLFEDNHLLVVKKPQNIPTQEDESKDEDMLNICKKYLKEKYQKSGNVYLGLVHRLDRPTGGILVLAKTSKAARRLTEQIQNGEFRKKYLAVVEGRPREKIAHLTHYLKKDEKNNKVYIVPELETGAKKADLEYVALDYINDLSLIEVSLFTGRSHQIRVQLSSIGCPIVSDIKYGAKKKITKNLSLWAHKLSFNHPTKNERLSFECFPPTNDVPWKDFNIKNL